MARRHTAQKPPSWRRNRMQSCSQRWWPGISCPAHSKPPTRSVFGLEAISILACRLPATATLIVSAPSPYVRAIFDISPRPGPAAVHAKLVGHGVTGNLGDLAPRDCCALITADSESERCHADFSLLTRHRA